MRRVVFGPKSKKIYFIMNLNIDSCNSLAVLLFSIAFYCFSLLSFVSFFSVSVEWKVHKLCSTFNVPFLRHFFGRLEAQLIINLEHAARTRLWSSFQVAQFFFGGKLCCPWFVVGLIEATTTTGMRHEPILWFLFDYLNEAWAESRTADIRFFPSFCFLLL